MNRYARQESLIGKEGQSKLAESTVAVAGCGGLGTYTSLMLVSSGVGNLILIDGGEPAETDLNRQFFYSGESGKKPDILAEKLSKINPSVGIRTECRYLDEDNAKVLTEGCDIIADCLDTVCSRRILNRFALSDSIPLAHAGIDGMYGQVFLVRPKVTPCLECFMRGDDERIPDAYAPAVSFAAALQASEIIKYVTGVGKPSELFTFSLRDGSFATTEIRPDPNCPACGARLK